VEASKINARSLEQQIADRQIESSKSYQLFSTEGTAVGQINGLAALDPGTGMAEYSGIMLPIVAQVTPAVHKDGGRIIATGKLGEIAKEAVENITAVIKKFSSKNIADVDIHLEYIGTYEGVEGDSASITMTTVILSALENIPIRQDMAMTGSLNVRGKVLPVGAVTAKLEAAAAAGIKLGIIPYDNVKDVMIRAKYYKTIELYGVRTYRDVAELAFVDCPAKEELLKRLDVLNPDGPTYVKVQPPAEMKYVEPVLPKEPEPAPVQEQEPEPEPPQAPQEPERPAGSDPTPTFAPAGKE
jgi:Lon-like ATP-dependent protease